MNYQYHISNAVKNNYSHLSLDNADHLFNKKLSNYETKSSFKVFIFPLKTLNDNGYERNLDKTKLVGYSVGTGLTSMLVYFTREELLNMSSIAALVTYGMAFLCFFQISQWLLEPIINSKNIKLFENKKHHLIKEFFLSLQNKNIFTHFINEIKELEQLNYIDMEDKVYLNRLSLEISEYIYKEDYAGFAVCIEDSLEDLEDILRDIEKYQFRDSYKEQLLGDNISEKNLDKNVVQENITINYKKMV